MTDIKIYADDLEAESEKQISEIANFRLFKDQRIRIMQDAHAGVGCSVGFTSTFGDAIIPNIVGVDISCGVNAYLIGKKHIDFQYLDDVVRSRIPSGMSRRDSKHPSFIFDYSRLACLKNLHDLDGIKRSVGTLGGGNHFIEIDEDENGDMWLVIHTGSRNLGKQVCEHYQNLGYEICGNKAVKSNGYLKDGFISKLKEDGNASLIGYVLQTMSKIERDNAVKKDLAWVEGTALNEYLNDCDFCSMYASANREAIAQEIFSGMGWVGWNDMISSVHNYVDTANKVIRKGAVAAYEGQRVIIPLNMAAGCIVGVGKGNEDYNWSAPHGAGRKMSRSKALRSLRVRDYRKQMEGVWSSSIEASTLDESPGAYKDASSIVEGISETVDVRQVMKPVYNFKAEAGF